MAHVETRLAAIIIITLTGLIAVLHNLQSIRLVIYSDNIVLFGSKTRMFYVLGKYYRY